MSKKNILKSSVCPKYVIIVKEATLKKFSEIYYVKISTKVGFLGRKLIICHKFLHKQAKEFLQLCGIKNSATSKNIWIYFNIWT